MDIMAFFPEYKFCGSQLFMDLATHVHQSFCILSCIAEYVPISLQNAFAQHPGQTVIRKCYSYATCSLVFAGLQGSNRLVLCPVNAEWRKTIRQLLRAWMSGPGESDTEKWGSNGRSYFQTLTLLRSLAYFTLKKDEPPISEREVARGWGSTEILNSSALLMG